MKSTKKIAKQVRKELREMSVDFRDVSYHKVNVREKQALAFTTHGFTYETYTAILSAGCGRSLYKHLIKLEKEGL